MSSASTDQKSSPSSEASSDNALGGLHRMSTTAGVGSQDYVAINNLAVTALIFGFISGAAFLGFVMLVIPLAGIFFGVVALKQIRNSGGTQTGSLLAWGGILLSLIFAGSLIGFSIKQSIAHREDRARIAVVVEDFDKAFRAKDYDAAYALFTPNFHQRVNAQKFKDAMSQLANTTHFGEMRKIDSYPLVHFEELANDRMASSYIIFDFVSAPQSVKQQGVAYRLVDGQWRIDDLPTFFPPEQRGGPGGPGGGPPRGM